MRRCGTTHIKKGHFNLEIEFLIKIIGIGLIVCVAQQILSKNGHDEQAAFVTIAGMLIVMIILMQKIAELVKTIRSLFGL